MSAVGGRSVVRRGLILAASSSIQTIMSGTSRRRHSTVTHTPISPTSSASSSTAGQRTISTSYCRSGLNSTEFASQPKCGSTQSRQTDPCARGTANDRSRGDRDQSRRRAARPRRVGATMIAIPGNLRVWLATDHTDKRRGCRSLALMVQDESKRDRTEQRRRPGTATASASLPDLRSGRCRDPRCSPNGVDRDLQSAISPPETTVGRDRREEAFPRRREQRRPRPSLHRAHDSAKVRSTAAPRQPGTPS
jgi:hypothetical protein